MSHETDSGDLSIDEVPSNYNPASSPKTALEYDNEDNTQSIKLVLGPNDPGDIGKHGRSETGPRQLSVELRQTAVKPVTVRLGP